MKKIAITLICALFITNTLFAKKKEFFGFIDVGFSKANFEQDDNKNKLPVVNDSDDEDGLVGEVGFGYRYKSYQTKLKYSFISLENAKIDNVIMSVGYKFRDTILKPYLGVLFGQSKLEWDKSVVEKAEDEDLTSKKPLYGVELEGEYNFSNAFSFLFSYNFYVTNHKTDVVAPSYDSKLKHKNFHNLLIGLKYSF